MTKIFTAIFISLLGFAVHAQEINDSPSISKPSCLSICGKQFLLNLDDNREVIFNKNSTALNDENKAVVETLLKTLSDKDISQKVAILLTSHPEANTKIKTKEALARAEALKRYFIMYGFPYQNITTEVSPYVKCTDEPGDCAKNSRKVNINTKGLPLENPKN